jgi:hypothetical protein
VTPPKREDRAESIRHRIRNAVRAQGHDEKLLELWGGSLYRPTAAA